MFNPLFAAPSPETCCKDALLRTLLKHKGATTNSWPDCRHSVRWCQVILSLPLLKWSRLAHSRTQPELQRRNTQCRHSPSSQRGEYFEVAHVAQVYRLRDKLFFFFFFFSSVKKKGSKYEEHLIHSGPESVSQACITSQMYRSHPVKCHSKAFYSQRL